MTSSLEREGVGGLKDDEWRHDDTGGGAFELKKIIIDPVYTVLPRNFFLNNYAFKGGGGEPKDDMMTSGRGLGWWRYLWTAPYWLKVSNIKNDAIYDSCFFVFSKWRAHQRKRAGILSHQNGKPTPWWENLALFSASWRLGLNFVSIIAKSLPIMCSQLVSCVGIISLSMISLFCRILSHF